MNANSWANIHMQIMLVMIKSSSRHSWHILRFDCTEVEKNFNHQKEVNSLLDFCKGLSINLLFPSKIYIEHLGKFFIYASKSSRPLLFLNICEQLLPSPLLEKLDLWNKFEEEDGSSYLLWEEDCTTPIERHKWSAAHGSGSVLEKGWWGAYRCSSTEYVILSLRMVRPAYHIIHTRLFSEMVKIGLG